MIKERVVNYNKEHCWQYDIRLNNYAQDVLDAGLTDDEVRGLRVGDFEFVVVTDVVERKALRAFIERYEWLGTLSMYTTHWFACYYHEILAGVILFNMPNAFSKLLGEDTHKMERLISRGACISWSPKNLASAFLMWCIKWMVQNTEYRLFTAYSDPLAKELGTIYQACNFYYLGNQAGTTTRYVNPYTGKIVSDRFFRQRSAYVKYAKELGVQWQSDWKDNTKMLWRNMPKEVEQQLRAYSKKKQAEATKIIVPSKHKYAYVLGRDARETRDLRRIYKQRNKVYAYPKER